MCACACACVCVRGSSRFLPQHHPNPGSTKDACPFSHDPTVIAAALGRSGPSPMMSPNAPAYKTTSGHPSGGQDRMP